MEYDVIIIGCGPAGLSAGIYCGRAGLKTVVIGLPEKSQAQLAPKIENYFGFPEGIDGSVLINKGVIHIQKFGVSLIREEVVAAANDDKTFKIKTSKDQELTAKAVIIATGTPIKLSGIKNEAEMTGRGVHYCVNCDGPMYKDKKIAVVGNGNHAAESAIEALSYSKDITIISNADKFQLSDEYDKELTKWQIKTQVSRVKEFKGEKFLESIVMQDGTEVKYDGVFMACGLASALDFAANLGLEIKDNILVVDENNRTSMDGVFAAGNCEGRCRQIAKNVGDGCNAAVNVIKYLRSKDIYVDYAHPIVEVKEDKIEISDAKPNPVQTLKTDTLTQGAGKKLRVGWFSFSCCEDSTIVFTEILNDYYDKLMSVVELVHARVLKKNNDMSNLDIAFVEGAISNDKQAEELKTIRANCKKLIAVGSCAVTGMPSGQRNEFDDRRKREIDSIVKAFSYRENVVPLHEIVQVDDNVPGCPMLEATFFAVLNKYIKEFGIDAQL
ncbi:MAG: FAD-dependent oxidoreductase [Candidatus Aenigmarchaeota archaeon]|nr:FAD-dependent oxidoreductase [Candidatus Aenigmarchaeota archaeon]